MLVGKLDPTHNIRMMGIPWAVLLLLPGHRRLPHGRVLGECAENKAKQKASASWSARRSSTTASRTCRTRKKPVRRGKPAGMREVSRAILKENSQLMQKEDDN